MGASRFSKSKTSERSHLRVVKDNELKIFSYEQVIDAAWSFAYTTLWNNSILSDREVVMAKRNIQILFATARDYKKALIDFVQQVVLARQLVQSAHGRYSMLPSVWLDMDNKQGFAVTKDWLKEIESVRASLPLYQVGIYHLAEAVFDYSMNPSLDTYHPWKEFLLRGNIPALYNLFQTFIINLSFGN
jgi:hypothetical protein